MKPITKQIIEDITAIDWFYAVGKIFGDLPKAQIARNWNHAIQQCCSPEWEHIQNVASERFWINVGIVSPKRADEWNLLTKEIFPVVNDLVETKLKGFILDKELLPKLIQDVNWDMRMALMEAEYLDIMKPGFYLSYIINVYHKGHFPCGWLGSEPPAGTPLIY
jgi:hypothetical protein